MIRRAHIRLYSILAALLTVPAAACQDGASGVQVREMLALRHADGLRHREIAELLGLSEVAVKQRMSRALRALRAELNPEPAKGAADVVA